MTRKKKPFPIVGAICGALIGMSAVIAWHDARASTPRGRMGVAQPREPATAAPMTSAPGIAGPASRHRVNA